MMQYHHQLIYQALGTIGTAFWENLYSIHTTERSQPMR
jgi:hypothetical protein